MKRVFDVLAAASGLLLTSPLLVGVALIVWYQDKHSPFFVADRVGRGGIPFRMVKLRSMVVGAASTGVDSTGANDPRITPVGHIIRRFKLDEITQLWNVFRGDMSLVGPRPNVPRETALYTDAEKRLLSVRPGITDFASIVFSDEADILRDHADPDLAYNQLIRPGKSRLGLFYVDHRSLGVDVQLCWLTAVSLISRRRALTGVQKLLRKLGASPDLVELAGRERELRPSPPPGADRIVTRRPTDTGVPREAV